MDSTNTEIVTVSRPRGLVPGTREWLVELEGPRLIKRLVDEVHAGEVGKMSPTQARCAGMLIDRVLPAMSTIHHTIESDLARKSEAELKQELKRLLAGEAETVPFVDVEPAQPAEPTDDRKAA